MSHPPSPRHVLMTTDPIGGVWVYTLELARQLGQQGIDVAIASMGKPLSTRQRQELRQIPAVEGFESPFKLEWMDDPWQDIEQAGEWLLSLEDQIQPDLVHLNGFVHGALPWRSPLLIVGHSCVLSWWQAVKREFAPPTWWEYQRRVATGLRQADQIVAPSRAMLNALQYYYGPFARGTVIYNSRDPLQFHASSPKQEFILAVGRQWDEGKNIEALNAIATGLPWPVYVAGHSQHPDGSTAQWSNVSNLGPLAATDLRTWFAQAAIYALPARYEPFGLSALEAGLSGCALVLGDIPSLREIWANAALFVPPDDPEALRDTLQQLIDHPQQRQGWAERAYARSRQFTPERMVHAYLKVYRRVIQQRLVQARSRPETHVPLSTYPA